MRPASGEKKKDKRRKRGTGGTSPDSRNVDRISPAERKEFERLARTPKQRDTAELKRYGFVGASEREQARSEKERVAETRRAGRLSPARKGQIRPQTPEERRALLAVALKRSGVMDDVERAPRFYDERSRSGQALRFLVGPPGDADTDEKIIGSIAAFPLFRPIRLLKAPIAAAGALRLGGGSSGARAAAEAAYKTPTIRSAVGRVIGRRGGEEAGTAAAARIGMATDPRLPQATLPEKAVTPSPEQQVRESLPAAAKARKQQEAGYSVERAKRFREAPKAFGQAGGGLAGHRAAKGQLKGELPKVEFNKLREGDYSPQELDRDMNTIYGHPDLKQGEITSAADALENMALHGITPQKAQIKLLGRVFGDDEAANLAARSLGDRAQDAIGLFRSLMTTLDLSLNMRQALPLLFRNPNIWRKSIGPQMKALLSKGKYKEADDLLHADSDFQLALHIHPRLFTHIQGRSGLERSEYFPSPLAEKIPGVKHPVRASSRAFEIGQNLGILNSFKSMLARAEKWGINIDPDTPEGLRELRGMAEVAGVQVGRGIFKTKTFRGAQPLLSHGLFAPSFYKSRLTWFSPRWYYKLPKVARYEAARTMVQFLGGSAAVLYGATQIPGVDVTPDPRSSDFGKVKLGDTRLDAMGGFQQYARLAAQIATGQYVNTKTGEVIDLKPGFAERTRWDVAMAFATGKASPPASFIIDLFKGTDYAHQPFEWKKAVAQRMTPLVLQDMWKVYSETDSVPAAGAAYLAAGAGIGVQTYTDFAAKKAQERTAQALGKWKEPAEKAWNTAHPDLPLPVEVLRAKQTDLMVKALRDELKESLKAREVPEKDRTPDQQNAIDKQELAIHFAVLFRTRPALEPHRAELQRFVRTADPAAVRGALTEVSGDLYEKVLRQFSEELSGIKAQERQKAYAE